MSDTEREAFDPDGFDESDLLPCPFCGSANVSLSEGSKADNTPWYYVECEDCASMAETEVWNRRTTTTEARSPRPPNLYVEGEQYCDGLGLCIKNTVHAGPPAPSVPSVSVDEIKAKASAVQRPAGGD